MTARLLPHALAATDHAQALGVDPIATAGLLHQAGRYLWSRAEYTQAKALHQRALSIREAEFGPDHPDTAHSLHNLANVLYAQGDLDDARSLYERALSIRETRLGADHPWTATILNDLGVILRGQGELDGARTLLNVRFRSLRRALAPTTPRPSRAGGISRPWRRPWTIGSSRCSLCKPNG
jgi:tetratricopeptide (TPR) repeat protein